MNGRDESCNLEVRESTWHRLIQNVILTTGRKAREHPGPLGWVTYRTDVALAGSRKPGRGPRIEPSARVASDRFLGRGRPNGGRTERRYLSAGTLSRRFVCVITQKASSAQLSLRAD